MKRLPLAALVIVVAVVGWIASQRRRAAVQGSGPLLPLAPMVDAGPLGESGAAQPCERRGLREGKPACPLVAPPMFRSTGTLATLPAYATRGLSADHDTASASASRIPAPP